MDSWINRSNYSVLFSFYSFILIGQMEMEHCVSKSSHCTSNYPKERLDNHQYGVIGGALHNWRFPCSVEPHQNAHPGAESLEFITALSHGDHAHHICEFRSAVPDLGFDRDPVRGISLSSIFLPTTTVISEYTSLDQFQFCDYFVLYAFGSIVIFAT
jgi:hypothetical protein